MMSTSTHSPVDDFSDCHAGITAALKKMSHLPELAAQAKAARETAGAVLHLFENVVMQHHAEEERDLFPAVIASALPGSERDEIQLIAQQLTDEHRAIETIWASIKSQVKAVAKGQEVDLPDDDVQALVTRYLAHAAYEEQRFLPRSQEILGRNGNHLAALGMTLHMRHTKMPVGYV